MAIEKDNFIDPNAKARWGFGGSEGNITVGPQTVGETGGVDTARTESDETAARNNGGGGELDALRSQVVDLQSQLAAAQSSSGSADTDPRDSLTIPQIKEQLDAKQIAYSSTANKPELLDLLKAQPQE